MNQPKRLMVMAGGTGGHVFPGLAVAHHLMEQGWQVRWLGTADRMEADRYLSTVSRSTLFVFLASWQRDQGCCWRRCAFSMPASGARHYEAF